MRAPVVVEGDPCGDAAVGFAAVGVALEVDVFVLKRAPQSLDEHVVHLPTAPIHRNGDPGGRLWVRPNGLRGAVF